MWFHLELLGRGYDSARVAVAVSKSVTGPYLYIKSFRPDAGFWPVNVRPYNKQPVKKDIKATYCGGKGCLPAHPDTLNLLGRDFKRGQMSRDMNLFKDVNEKAYLIYTSEDNSTLHISELTEDYLSTSGKYFRIFADRCMEGAAMYMEYPVVTEHFI